MIKNHIKIAWRSLKKQPFFTFLNTFGLAIGIAGGLLISLYIYDELSFDRMFDDYEHIYRVDSDIKFGGKGEEYAVAPAPLASTLLKDYSQVQQVVRFRDVGSRLLKSKESTLNIRESQSCYADSTFFEFFGLELLYGDKATALKNPNTLVLTRTAAEKHFKIDKAVGQSLTLDNDEIYTISGVIEDLPSNSFLRNHSVFLAMEGNNDALNTMWGSNNYATFIKLLPNINPVLFRDEIQNVVKTYVMDWAQAVFPGIKYEDFLATGNYLNYQLTPLKDIHLKSARVGEMSPNSSIDNVYILFFIGLFLIILASVNFMNLSTAQSLKRAKEVGIRKTLGSNKRGLIRQFLTESGLISFISLSLAIVFSFIALPFFNDLASKSIQIPFANPMFWLILLLATLILSLLSGSYPSFFLSQFSPIKVLKGTTTGTKGGGVRNFLVVFQFAISVFLLISTGVVYQQLSYIQNKDVGFQKEQILIIDDLGSISQKAQPLKNEVEKLSQVENISLSSFLPTPSSRSDNTYHEEGIQNQKDHINMQEWAVDHAYINTLNIKLLAGRDFSKSMSTDSSAMIINESAVALLGKTVDEAIGTRIVDIFGNDGQPFVYTVIGVIENFNYESLRQNVGALNLTLGNFPNKMIVKLKAGDFESTIAQIEKNWVSLAPEQPFNHYFMDDSFNRSYEAEQRLGRIFITFTLLSLLIASLGLFGLAAFNAEKRIKEIGIRKVMGASVGQIVFRLSADFLKLVFISIIISLPFGWYAMDKWLEDFSYRIDFPWWIFLAAAIVAIVISLVTVSYQSIKAAIVDPVKSLKSE